MGGLQTESNEVPALVKLFLKLISFPLFFVWTVLWLKVPDKVLAPESKLMTRWGFHLKVYLQDFIEAYVLLFGVWEPDISAFLDRRLKLGRMFIDVGSHAGYHSLLASRRVGETGKVLALDACSLHVSALKQNLKSNGNIPNVEVVHAAVTDQERRVPVYGPPRANRGWATTRPSTSFSLEEEVSGGPLGHWINESDYDSIQVIKIDVEGTEGEIIAGMTPLLSLLPDDVEFLIELSPLWWEEPKPAIEEVVAPLLKAGFHPYRIQNSYFHWRYLWPASIQNPRRVRGPIKAPLGQIDLVFSRLDADAL